MFIPGGRWKGAANGRLGDLEIEFTGGDRFIGKAFGGHPINGRWQAASGNISFITTDGSGQVYKGQLVFPHSDTPVAAVYTLAGCYDDLAGTYGWFAQQSVVP